MNDMALGENGMDAGSPDRAASLLGLRLFFWGFVVKETCSLLVSVVFYLLPRLISYDTEAGGGWSLSDYFRLVGSLSTGIQILGLSVCCAGLWLLVSRRKDPIGLYALVGHGVALGLALVWFLLRLTLIDIPRVVGEVMWILNPLAELTGLVLLVVMLGRAARIQGLPPSGLALPIYITCGLSFLVPRIRQLMWLLEVDYLDSAIWYSILSIGMSVLGLVLLVLVVFLLLDGKRILSGQGDPESRALALEPTILDQAPWPTVRGGVAAYRAGLIAKIWVVLLGLGLLMLAIIGRSEDMARGMLIIMPLGGMITTGWMLFGLFGYAQVPAASGGRGPAVLALVMMGLATLLDLYGMVLAFQMLSDRHSAMRDALEIAPWIEGSAQAIGLLGAMGLLFSIARVGRHVDAPDISRRVGVVAFMLGLTAAGTLLVRVLAASRAVGGMGMIPLALGLLILAIVTLVMFLGVLKDFRRAIGAFGDAKVFD